MEAGRAARSRRSTHADWQHAFDLYQATPEYREINGPAGMDLAAFKFIFSGNGSTACSGG